MQEYIQELDQKRNVPAIVKKLKDNEQDHEFYPTTNEIIQKIKSRIKDTDSVLDCGAGDGTTLSKLTEGKKYAIEKSEILLKLMPKNIFVVGCDFHENSLIDKKVDVVFCNPPYTEYSEWAMKVISEANAGNVFLVLPERWKDNNNINGAIADRKATTRVILTTDFLDAERKARAKVDVIQVSLHKYNGRDNQTIDPFSLWVEKEFPLRTKDKAVGVKPFKEKVSELVPGKGFVPALVMLYQDELATLQTNFRAISGLDPSIFSELKVDFNSITNFLKMRIEKLKDKYWREVFSHFKAVTSRLTKGSRENLLNTLTKNISVDFTESNIYAVATWVIKNANSYFDSQLIEMFECLCERANLVKYKSNKKTWGDDGWRFREDLREGHVKDFGLDYRCVISCYTTFSDKVYEQYDYPNGLNQRVHDLLNDIITVANNLGFVAPSFLKSEEIIWEPGKLNHFYMNKEEDSVLMSVRAYKNGNIHIKFNQKFLRKLNVEFGRLKGWLRDHQQAADELNIPVKEAKTYFRSNLCLCQSSIKLLAA